MVSEQSRAVTSKTTETTLAQSLPSSVLVYDQGLFCVQSLYGFDVTDEVLTAYCFVTSDAAI